MAIRTSAKLLLFCIGISYLVSCGDKHADAQLYLQNTREMYEKGNYDAAKARIDSIQILFPKSFDQIKEGIALLHDVRKAQNQKTITYCDSVAEVLKPKVDSMKKLFSFQINKDYEEMGRYMDKRYTGYILNGTTLRPSVREDGRLFLESVYVGAQKYHDRLKVSTKEGFFAETLPVTDDGLNFRFTDSGRQYEVIMFTGDDENGVSKFITSYADHALTVSLQGKSITSYTLSKDAKNAVADAYQLAVWMQDLDSIKIKKEKAEMLIDYLNKQKAGELPGKEEIQ